MKKILLISIPFLFCSCAQNLIIDYGSRDSSVGHIIVQPSARTPQSYLSIDDKLLVTKKNVRSITVNNVPVGERKVHFMTNSSNFKEKVSGEYTVNVLENKTSVKLVELPPYSGGYWAAQIVGSVMGGLAGIVAGLTIATLAYE
jgi:hypothetical protein